MPEAPYLREYDTRIPFYDRTPRNRALRAACVKFVDGFGTHLICPRRACRRGGACADRNMRALPFCWEHYRGMPRFRLGVVADHHRQAGGSGGEAEAAGEPVMPTPFTGKPLLAALAEDGVPIQELARAAEDGPDDFTWEVMPEYRELFRELTADCAASDSLGGGG